MDVKSLGWRKIWGSRKIENQVTGSLLERLIALDGFDSPLGLMSEADWRLYGQSFYDRGDIKLKDSLFEIGCGAGAFLYLFHDSGHNIGGLDFSPPLIAAAKEAMPTAANQFILSEAINCSPYPKADVVLANHVIHYFESLEYVKDVIKKMIEKSLKAVAFYGVPNFEKRTASESARRGILSVEEYNNKYKGIEILYFDKSWFQEIAINYGLSIQFYDHMMPGFVQNEFRFDCVMTVK